jgi:hypothetical protein
MSILPKYVVASVRNFNAHRRRTSDLTAIVRVPVYLCILRMQGKSIRKSFKI